MLGLSLLLLSVWDEDFYAYTLEIHLLAWEKVLSRCELEEHYNWAVDVTPRAYNAAVEALFRRLRYSSRSQILQRIKDAKLKNVCCGAKLVPIGPGYYGCSLHFSAEANAYGRRRGRSRSSRR